MGQHIGHLDADCFYVSCERVRYRSLQGQAVGLLGNQGACIIAKSYEMKARGVTTGMPIWDALPPVNMLNVACLENRTHGSKRPSQAID